MQELTEKQRETLTCIIGHLLRDQRVPTVREVAEALEITSSPCNKRVKLLIEKGYLQPRVGRRGYTVARWPNGSLFFLGAPLETLGSYYVERGANGTVIRHRELYGKWVDGPPPENPEDGPGEGTGGGAVSNSIRVRRYLADIMVQHDPVFVWAQQHPGSVGYETWKGLATNLADLAGEEGRAAFHDVSRLDAGRYDEDSANHCYDLALASASDYGPMTYETFGSLGDWPYSPQIDHAPASRAKTVLGQ